MSRLRRIAEEARALRRGQDTFWHTALDHAVFEIFCVWKWVISLSDEAAIDVSSGKCLNSRFDNAHAVRARAGAINCVIGRRACEAIAAHRVTSTYRRLANDQDMLERFSKSN